MYENVDILPSFIWMEIVGILSGMIQFKVGFPRNLLQFVALVSFIEYGYVFITFLYLPFPEASKTSADYKGVFRYSSASCRLVEFIYIIQKCFWYQRKNTDLKNLLYRIKMGYTSWKFQCTGIPYIIPFLGFLCIILVEIYIFEDYFSKFEYMINWGYPNLIIILEYCFIQEINQNLKAKFSALKNKLKLINDTTVEDEDQRWSMLNILMELNKVDMENKLSEIQELSRRHYGLVEITKEISEMFSFNILLTTCVILCNIINGAYNIVTHFNSARYSMKAVCRSSTWIIYQIYLSVIIIDSWHSLANECNKSMRIIHEIWNKCVSKRSNSKKLNYFHFIALRFHSTKLKFTADGFFNIDRTLYHSVVACVTTYVIILVQIKYPNQ